MKRGRRPRNKQRDITLQSFWNYYFQGAYEGIDPTLYCSVMYLVTQSLDVQPYLNGGCRTTYAELSKICNKDWRCVKAGLQKLEVAGLLVCQQIGRHLLIVPNIETKEEKKTRNGFSPTSPLPKERKEKKEKSVRKEKEKTHSQDLEVLEMGNSIEQRRAQFQNEVAQFLPQYGRQICNEFFSTWTEMTPDKQFMRFELEKTWNTATRIARWKRYDLKIKGKNETPAAAPPDHEQRTKERFENERKRDLQAIDAIPQWAFEVAKHFMLNLNCDTDAFLSQVAELKMEGRLNDEQEKLFKQWVGQRTKLKQNYERKYKNS